VKTATMVSIDMSMGSDVTVDAAAVCEAMDDNDGLVAWRAECSWAE